MTPNGNWLVCCAGAGIVREFDPVGRAGRCVNELYVGELTFDECKKANATADSLRVQIKAYIEESERSRLEAEEAKREIERLRRELQGVRLRLSELDDR